MAADTGYSSMSWEKMLTPGICTNRKKAITSLGWVREQAHKDNCIAAIANHDTKVNQQTIELPY